MPRATGEGTLDARAASAQMSTANAARSGSGDSDGSDGRGLSQKELFVHAVTTSCCAAAILSYRDEPPTGVVSWIIFILASVVANYFVQFICSAILLALYLDVFVGLPTSPVAADCADEMHAWWFPDSAQAREVASRRSCGIDHLVYICQNLDDGIKAVHR